MKAIKQSCKSNISQPMLDYRFITSSKKAILGYRKKE